MAVKFLAKIDLMRNSNHNESPLLEQITRAAHDNGLKFMGVTSLNVTRDGERYQTWLDEGRHAGMTWMANHMAIRNNPSLLHPNAKSAFVFGFDYFLGDKWSLGQMELTPKVAQYARIADYHKFMRSKLTKVTKKLSEILGEQESFRITVDSAPLLERAIAAKTGSIFIGKNTCAIHPKQGSFFLLGEIISTWFDPELILEKQSTHQNRSESGGCGTCRRCQVHCPTGALDQDYRIDARKCLSYWTIEHRGEIPREYWQWVARYIFGCDICQLVCPYNRHRPASPESQSLSKIDSIDLLEMATMDQAKYEEIFGGTPMTRAKRSGLRRNAIIAATVRRDTRVTDLLGTLSEDEDPTIKATAKAAIDFLTK